MKIAYPMRVNLRKGRNGKYSAQVTIQTRLAGVYRSPVRDISETPISASVGLALGKAEGRDEATQEAKDYLSGADEKTQIDE